MSPLSQMSQNLVGIQTVWEMSRTRVGPLFSLGISDLNRFMGRTNSNIGEGRAPLMADGRIYRDAGAAYLTEIKTIVKL